MFARSKAVTLLVSLFILSGCAVSQPEVSIEPTSTSISNSTASSQSTIATASPEPASESVVAKQPESLSESAKPASSAQPVGAYLSRSKDSALTLENLDEYDIPQIAQDAFWSYLNAQPKVSNFSNLELHISEHVPVAYTNERIEDLKKAMAMWKSEFWPEKVTVLIYVPQDATWAENECTVVIVAYDCGEQEFFDNTGWAKNSASSTKDGSAFFQIGINGEDKDPRFLHTGAGQFHEYWHTASVGPGGTWQGSNVMLWWFEGSADFMGQAYDKRTSRWAPSKAFDPWNEGYDETRFQRVMRSLTPEQSQDIFTKLHNHEGDRDKLAHYELGSYATEALVAVYGFNTFVEFSNCPKGVSFGSQFERVYGLSLNEFYGKLAPYLQHRVDY